MTGTAASRIDDHVPRRAPAASLFTSAVVTTGAWLVTPLEGVLRGRPASR